MLESVVRTCRCGIEIPTGIIGSHFRECRSEVPPSVQSRAVEVQRPLLRERGWTSVETLADMGAIRNNLIVMVRSKWAQVGCARTIHNPMTAEVAAGHVDTVSQESHYLVVSDFDSVWLGNILHVLTSV